MSIKDVTNLSILALEGGLGIDSGTSVNYGTTTQVLTSGGSSSLPLVWKEGSAVAAAGAWALTGNSGTTTATNFIGTNDGANLAIKAAGSIAILISGSLAQAIINIGLTTNNGISNSGGISATGLVVAGTSLQSGTSCSVGTTLLVGSSSTHTGTASFLSQVLVASGVAATPSIGATTFPTTGPYYASGPTYGLSVSGTSVFELASSSLFIRTLSKELRAANANSDVASINRNQSNTSGANAVVQTIVAGTASGDPTFVATVTGGTSWAIGARNTDSDILYFSPSSDLSTAPNMKITSSGSVTVGNTATTATHTIATTPATTVGSIGTATALPIPVAYFPITIGSLSCKIALFNP